MSIRILIITVLLLTKDFISCQEVVFKKYFRAGTATIVSISTNGEYLIINDRHSSDYPFISMQVYQLKYNEYIRKGPVIYAKTQGDVFQISDMSNNGNTIVIGCPRNYLNMDLPPYVLVYDYIDNKWVQKGNKITSISGWDWTGSEVKVSKDGNSIAVGSSNYKSTPTSFRQGAIRVFDYINDSWVQRGEMIAGEFPYDEYGANFECDEDINRIAVMVHSPSEFSQKELIYEWNGERWIKIFQTDKFGNSYGYLNDIFFSRDGNILNVNKNLNKVLRYEYEESKGTYEFIDSTSFESDIYQYYRVTVSKDGNSYLFSHPHTADACCIDYRNRIESTFVEEDYELDHKIKFQHLSENGQYGFGVQFGETSTSDDTLYVYKFFETSSAEEPLQSGSVLRNTLVNDNPLFLNVQLESYRIFNQIGQRVQYSDRKVISTIEVNEIPTGIYFLSYELSDGISRTEKFIKI